MNSLTMMLGMVLTVISQGVLAQAELILPGARGFRIGYRNTEIQ
jgi:hypothetical protein